MIGTAAEHAASYGRGVRTIGWFRGRYGFLSNFHEHPVKMDDGVYPNAEAAFQSRKSEDSEYRAKLRAVSFARDAKALGRRVDLRPDWDSIKDDAMRETVRAKFADDSLARMLLETGGCVLIEGNRHGDAYWGVPFGSKGRNRLGEILMEVREELRKSLRAR